MSKKVVAVCGAFDPLHAGHLDNIIKAKALGDYLVVILNSDDDVIRKRGVVFMPFGQRLLLLKSIRYVDEVVVSIDNDGTVAKTLRMIKPDILAKGGDRISSNMPKAEIEVCREIGCEIVYGVGELLSSSTDMIRRIKEFKGEIRHNPVGDFKL